MVAAAVQASGGSASSSGDHITIIEMDGQQMMEYVQKLAEKKVKLKLSPGKRGGRVA